MSCNNCFNGCDTIVSDQCVKYTGSDYENLEIAYGDTLQYVINAIILAIEDLQSGDSIFPDFGSEGACDLVRGFLPEDPDERNLNIVLRAYMDAICDLDFRVVDLETFIETLNATYTLNCLDPGTNNNTHDVLQALINFTCILKDDLTALALDVETNYVRVDEIDQYIENYLSNSETSTLVSNKMIPYVAMEYYGPLTNFDVSGAGIGDWAKVYLCNGQNGTPDKRGVVAVGATTGMSGGPFNPSVDPSLPGNPSYSLGTIVGANTVGISQAQMPSHTHTGITVSSGEHTHQTVALSNPGSEYTDANKYTAAYRPSGGDSAYGLQGTNVIPVYGTTTTDGSHTHGLTIDPIGGGQPHPNVQPGIGCYFIMYRP